MVGADTNPIGAVKTCESKKLETPTLTQKSLLLINFEQNALKFRSIYHTRCASLGVKNCRTGLYANNFRSFLLDKWSFLKKVR